MITKKRRKSHNEGLLKALAKKQLQDYIQTTSKQEFLEWSV